MREFYDDPDRAESPEVDFGSAWRTQGRGPWKVVWLEWTGELVAFDVAGDEVVVVGYAEDRDELVATLAGWAAHMGDENGLAWLVERCDNEPDVDEG